VSANTDSRDLPSPTFCPAPWMHLYADEHGTIRPCCKTRGGIGHENLDEAGNPYRMGDPGAVDAAWNSPFSRGLRRDMLEGRRPAVCRHCFHDEDVGIFSYRQGLIHTLQTHIGEARRSTGPDGYAPIELIRSIDLQLGNLCNLRCRMCLPIFSKLLIPEHALIHGVSTGDERFARLRNIDWFRGEETERVFEKLLPNLERLHFMGGEPLLIPEMFDYLERAISSGRAGEISLSYSTNLTTLPARAVALWRQFREVELFVSLDGYGAVNGFIRYPSHWEAIHENLSRLDLERSALGCTDVYFNTTVQVYNILRLDELLEYTLDTFENLDPFPTLSLLAYPSCFSIQVLPPDLKREAAERLNAFVARRDARPSQRWRGKNLARFRASLEGVVAHMMEADRSDEAAEFLRRNAVYDRQRGQDVRTIIPELSGMFDRSV
jgi:hypothetical protein